MKREKEKEKKGKMKTSLESFCEPLLGKGKQIMFNVLTMKLYRRSINRTPSIHAPNVISLETKTNKTKESKSESEKEKKRKS